MIENLSPWPPRFLLPLWQKMLHWLSGRSKAIQLIFVEQPGNFWTYLDDEGTIQLHLMLDVTSASKVIVFITRVQIRRIGWLQAPPDFRGQLPALRDQRTAVCEVRCRSHRRESSARKGEL